jgi:hypothetical protein
MNVDDMADMRAMCGALLTDASPASMVGVTVARRRFLCRSLCPFAHRSLYRPVPMEERR